MAKILNKMLNLVGWETEEEMQEELEHENTVNEHALNYLPPKKQGKVVNIHSSPQYKLVITQPANLDEARDVCNHLKNKKPVVVNLEYAEKESAQRITDFISGSVYALDGHIQKISNAIFIIAPSNIDIMPELKDEMHNKNLFPWVK